MHSDRLFILSEGEHDDAHLNRFAGYLGPVSGEREFISLQKRSRSPQLEGRWETTELTRISRRVVYLGNLAGKFLVTTLPSLGHHLFPKSSASSRPTYAYTFHSLIGPQHAYKSGAFDQYDIVFSPARWITDELAAMWERRTSAPMIIEAPYPRLDNLFQAARSGRDDSRTGEFPVVTVAPTWGPSGLLNSTFDDVIRALSEIKCEVYLRFHPMSWKHERRTVKRSIRLANHYLQGRVEVVRATSEAATLMSSDLLVADLGGTAMEYFLATGRPVLYGSFETKSPGRRKVTVNTAPPEAKLASEIQAAVENDAFSCTKTSFVADRILNYLYGDHKHRLQPILERWSDDLYLTNNSADAQTSFAEVLRSKLQ